jgi:hypothetical protein
MASPPPTPISIEEIENLSEIQLRMRVNEWFAYLAVCGNEQRGGVVAQAEFYMRELERRENAAVAARDFRMSEEDRRTNATIAARDLALAERSHKMEKGVIWLIGAELLLALVGLVYGYIEGSKQQKVLEQMGKNTHDTAGILSGQGEILGKMNTNTHDTVDAVGKLQSVQNDSLAAQQNTLRSIGRMNAALQQQLDLASRAPVITFSNNSSTIQVVPLDIIEHPRELVGPEEGLIYNGGKAALMNGSVVAFTDQQDVKISCADGKTPCKQHMEPGYVFPGVDFDFGTLAVHRGVPIKFSVSYMSNHKPFIVRLSVSGDNIEDSKVADITIDPTMSPPQSPKH